jgi:two-component system, cell cycle response regulator
VKADQASWTAGELVPLADRLRYMRFLRVVLAAVVAVVGGLHVGGIAPANGSLWPATAGYVAAFAFGEAGWRLWRRRGLWLFGLLLVIDAAYLMYAVHLTGGLTSPMRNLILLHLIAVALLASYRTGLKLVLWYVLLLMLEFQMPASAHQSAATGGSDWARLIFFASVLSGITLGTATLSAVNERELRRRRFDLEALASLAERLENATESSTVAATTVDAIVDNFGIDRIALVGVTPHLELLAGHGLASPQLPALPVSPVVDDAAQLRATLLPAALKSADEPWLTGLLPDAHNIVVTPMYAEGGCLGVLVFEHGARRGSRIERRLLTIIERFASHAALALRNATLLERVQQAASTDALTGIANRRAFEEALDREVARSARTGEPVSLVMLDLDHFKVLNDTHGHQMGDEVLREVAAALSAHCRDMDVAARYGGEEFTVILPNCGTEEIEASAQRLWASVCERPLFTPITVSAGYATFPDNARTGPDLVFAADQALYQAKRAGRNRVMGSQRSLPRTRLGVVAERNR